MNRRDWVEASAAAILGLGLPSGIVFADECDQATGIDEQAANEPDVDGLDVIDCHTHFYDPQRPEGIPWPGEDSSLFRTVLPQHLRALKKFRPVTGTVVIEASSRLEDNAWLLELASDDPFVVGIVGNLTPGDAEFARHVKRFTADPLYRGIRISSALVRELLKGNAAESLRPLVDHDLTLDVNGGPDTPALLADLAERVPDLRIVQNHEGNVPITADAPPADWRQGIEAAAKQPNVYCKISALPHGAAREGKPAPRDLEFYRPYIDVVWNSFGDDRVIYGSDWPVSERVSSYFDQQRVVMEYAFEKGDEATRKFCSLNAKRAYKWVDRPGRL